jgi:hypothetical protein
MAAIRRPAGRITLHTADTDRLGVLVESILVDQVPGACSAKQLRRRLLALGRKLDYLAESLVLVEHDPTRTGALMRSASPHQTGAHRDYFELRVERNRDASLRRFRQPPGGGERAVLPVLLDRDTLARLIDDLLSALAA